MKLPALRIRARRYLLPVLLVAGTAVILAYAMSVPAATQPPQPVRSEQVPTPRAMGLIGAGSCAASACHGGNKSVPEAWHKSYSTWASFDRHSRACSVLHGEVSKHIERLWLAPGEKYPRQAWEDTRCLGCHAGIGASEPPPRVLLAAGLLSDGVSCEACHGPAQQWLVPHTLRTLSTSEKSALGMRDLTDLRVRAENCTSCHVGAAAKPGDSYSRDVNHELIAAGHPRLNFEFSAFQANMPRHWARRDDEATVWAVGQVVSTRSALELLAGRATQADLAGNSTPAVWPEFSEYSCYSCHRSLNTASQVVGAPPLSNATSGQLQWSGWHTALADVTAKTLKGAADPLTQLQNLQDHMQTWNSPPGQIAQDANDAARQWGELLTSAHKIDGSRARVIARAICQRTGNGQWDDFAQTYLALVALHNAQVARQPDGPTPSDAAIDRALGTLREELQFIATRDSATGKIQLRYDSPRNFNPDAARAMLNKLKGLWGPG